MVLKREAFAEELDKTLVNLIPGVSSKKIIGNDLSQLEVIYKKQKLKSGQLLSRGRKNVKLLLFKDTFKYGRHFEFERNLQTKGKDFDYRFIECFASALQQDLKKLSISDFDGVIERSLRETRFRRAIAKFSGFNSSQTFRWIKAMEDSILLTYEQRPARHVILVPEKIDKFRQRYSDSCLFFKKPLSLEEGLINEKWVRSVVDGKKVALLSEATGNSAIILGIIALESLPFPPKHKEAFAAPHFSVVKLQSILQPQDVVIFTAPTGDLFIMMGKNVVFQKTQGFWRYHNYDNLHSKIMKYVKMSNVRRDLLRIVLDLSYERRGALFCISEAIKIPKIIDNPDSQNRGNKTLRDALIGLSINDWNIRRIIGAVASIDGAVVLDKRGQIHDVACVVKDLTPEESENLTQPQIINRDGLVGTRSLAAWRASRYGLAIKISEDGPITLFENLREVGKYG